MGRIARQYCTKLAESSPVSLSDPDYLGFYCFARIWAVSKAELILRLYRMMAVEEALLLGSGRTGD